MTRQTHCPWWCDGHRSGEGIEDEQHARLFDAPEDAWVAILCGTLPSDRPELTYGADAYDPDSVDARRLALALVEAADVFDRVLRGDPPGP